VKGLLERPGIRAALCLLGLALLAGLFFREGLFGGHRTLIWDASDYHYPYLSFVSRLWRHGELPRWNPFLFNGYPLLAQPHSQVFYPPNLLITLAAAFTPRVVYFQIVLHLLLGGFFTYLLAGLWMQSTAARLLAGVVYMLNGFMWNHLEHVAIIDTLVWLPLVLYASARLWRERTPATFALTVASVALLILAGHPQTFYYSLLLVAAATPFWAMTAPGEPGLRAAWRPGVLLALAVVVGLLLCAVQLIPTYELTQLSNRRARVPYEIAVAAGALRPSHLITLLLPDFHGCIHGPYRGQGDISQSSIYFGVVPLLLVGLVMASPPRSGARSGMPLLLMALGALLISLGTAGRIDWLLYHLVPGFAAFRSPAHFAFIFSLFAALLAGQGLEALQSNSFSPIRYLAFLGGLGLMLWLLIKFVSPPHPALAANLHRDTVALLAGLVAVVAVVALRRAEILGARSSGILLLAASVLELCVVGRGAVTLGEMNPPTTFCEELPSSLVAAAGGGPGEGCRPAVPPFDHTRAASAYRLHVDAPTYREGDPRTNVGRLSAVGFNRFLLHQGFLTDGWDPMVLRRHVELHMLLQRLSAASDGKPIEDKVSALGKVLPAANVKHLLIGRDLHEIPDPLPRAYFVFSARPAADGSQALGLLADPGVDLRSEVIIEGETPPAPAPPEAKARWAPVRFVSQSSAEVSLIAEAPRPGYVVFSDTYYPGWQASVNGRPAPVLRANQSFTAVRVDAGTSEVRFRFRSRALRAGAILSLLTLALATAGLAIWKRRARAAR